MPVALPTFVTTTPHPTPEALATALRQLLAPLARLALAQGLTHATLDELLKQALVAAADEALASLPPHRRVSRITTTTGIHRREVSRLVEALREGAAQQTPPARSHASELFTRWRTDCSYGDSRGSPAELPRQGPVPSFETLAQAITRDVHPRSLLDELLRLGLAAHDRERDTVRLLREAFVPQGDSARMVQVLGRNVGAHLESAVDNVLLDNHRHFEQAIFADGLGETSMAEFRRLVSAQWQTALATLVPALEAMIARDAAAPTDAERNRPPARPPARHQVRLGLYTHARSLPPDAADEASTDAPTP